MRVCALLLLLTASHLGAHGTELTIFIVLATLPFCGGQVAACPALWARPFLTPGSALLQRSKALKDVCMPTPALTPFNTLAIKACDSASLPHAKAPPLHDAS